MNIINTNTFEQQLKSILETIAENSLQTAKNFKLYLDTILYNMPTKAQKYKKSVYIDNENIRDIDHEGYTIPFYIDNEKSSYVILGIFKK